MVSERIATIARANNLRIFTTHLLSGSPRPLGGPRPVFFVALHKQRHHRNAVSDTSSFREPENSLPFLRDAGPLGLGRAPWRNARARLGRTAPDVNLDF